MSRSKESIPMRELSDPITTIYRIPDNALNYEALDADLAERVMAALSDPLEWYELEDAPGRAWGRKHDTALYYLFPGSRDTNPNPASFIVSHRKDDTVTFQELLITSTGAAREFTTMDEAKAACDTHFATGTWPQ